ncbi:MAG: hypothetical protein MJ252_29040 [archaeon]|nr:hypothetical protein [archaeon]
MEGKKPSQNNFHFQNEYHFPLYSLSSNQLPSQSSNESNNLPKVERTNTKSKTYFSTKANYIDKELLMNFESNSSNESGGNENENLSQTSLDAGNKGESNKRNSFEEENNMVSNFYKETSEALNKIFQEKRTQSNQGQSFEENEPIYRPNTMNEDTYVNENYSQQGNENEDIVNNLNFSNMNYFPPNMNQHFHSSDNNLNNPSIYSESISDLSQMTHQNINVNTLNIPKFIYNPNLFNQQRGDYGTNLNMQQQGQIFMNNYNNIQYKNNFAVLNDSNLNLMPNIKYNMANEAQVEGMPNNISENNINGKETINKYTNINPNINNVNRISTDSGNKFPNYELSDYLFIRFGKRGWECKYCSNFNFESKIYLFLFLDRIKCNRCGRDMSPRPLSQVHRQGPMNPARNMYNNHPSNGYYTGNKDNSLMNSNMNNNEAKFK